MQVNTVCKLGDIITGALQIEDNGLALYLDTTSDTYNVDSPCAILDPEDSSDPGGIEPDFAIANGMKFGLFISDVKDVIRNAQLQEANPSVTTLLDALNYYLEFDAFIEFDNRA